MLVSQDGGRHQHSHLLGIASSLESSTHSHLGLAKAYITTYQTIHRARLLHISLHILSGLQLVGRILIQETGFQLLLHEGISREGKTYLTTTGCIELDQVTGYILQLGLGAFLHAFPLACAQMGKTRWLAIVLCLIL